MNAIAYTLILLLARVIIPFGILILFGEWMRWREKNYWLRM